METPRRRYLCVRCPIAVIICSRSDRGQRYCANGCARQARLSLVGQAGQRYQASRCGRHKHAERQRRNRERKAKVKHQGTLLPGSSVQLQTDPTLLRKTSLLRWYCDFCYRPLNTQVRNDFMRRRSFSPLPIFRRGTPRDPGP